MQTINLYLHKKSIIPVLHAKQGDVGRKFQVEFADGIPDGVAFSAWYYGTSGEGNYTAIGDRSAFSVSGNTVTVELITQMLTKPGTGKLCLIMSADDLQLASWNIPYEVEHVPGMDSDTAYQYFTAFSEMIKSLPYPDATLTAVGKSADAAAVGAALAKKMPAMESADHSGCYFLVDDGVIRWINPPMIPGVEYRTICRRKGQPEYTKLLLLGEAPADETNSIPHDIADVLEIDGEFLWSANGETIKGNAYFVNGALGAYAWVTADSVGIRSVTVDTTGVNVSVVLRYTKTTD